MVAIGVWVGWHWKLTHRSWQDMERVKRLARGQIPELKRLRAHHTAKGFWIFVVILVLLLLALHR
jgi:hypothetical protein